jgi:two-component system sensor histidine kinase RegB
VPSLIDPEAIRFGRDARRLKLDTLVRLRWLAICGQTAAVAIVHSGLGFTLPFSAAFAVIATSVALNLGLAIRRPASHRLTDDAATALLAFDILQLAALLFLTGGLQNPFAILFMAPVLISAAALPPGRTIGLGTLAVICATLLVIFRRPLPWMAASTLELPFTYVVGIWSALLLGIAFTGVFAWRVAEEARQLGQALAATELVLAREQHLSQLDGLAAAAAHELGTPLATIALVAKELDLQAPPGSPMAEDTKLLREQVERCRGILGKLTSLGDDDGGFLETMTLSQLIEEVVAPHRAFGIPILIERHGDRPEPACRRSPGVVYGLGNLIDNAVDFAREALRITVRWSEDEVLIEIRDDGPGFAPDVLLRVGEPYVTTRGTGAQGGDEGGAAGLGLGLFIAKTLLERSGADLTLSNSVSPDAGAIARVTWPRHVFENRRERDHENAAMLQDATTFPISVR